MNFDSNKKSKLFLLLEENDSLNEENYIQTLSQQKPQQQISPPLSQASQNPNESSLDNSTVPTYEEFTKKTISSYMNKYNVKKNRYSTHRLLNSTNNVSCLVTDDESQEEDTEADAYNSDTDLKVALSKSAKNKLNLESNFKVYIKSSTTTTSNTNSATTSASENEMKKKATEVVKNTPPLSAVNKSQTPVKKILIKELTTPKNKHIDLIRNTPSSVSKSPGEYLIYDTKDTQTSFTQSQETNQTYEDENNESANKTSISKNNSIVNDSIDEMTKNFKLNLSSSSSTSSPNDSKKKIRFKKLSSTSNVTMRKSRPSNNSMSIKQLEIKPKNKRVSICGDAFSDNVLKIDDSILDEYENELDYKSGKLITLNETLNLKSNEKKASNSVSKEKPKTDSSSNDERFEQFLSQYKRIDNNLSEKTEAKNYKKNELKDFIVEEEDEDDIIEISGDSFKVSPKKNVKKNSKNKNKLFASSSSENEKQAEDTESTSNEDDDLYGKDLQLFYIRTNKKLNDSLKTKKTKEEKKIPNKIKQPVKSSRSSLLDDSTSFISLSSTSSSSLNSDSDSNDAQSPVSLSSSSSLNSSSSSFEETRSRNIFRNIVNKPNFKTISSNLNTFRTPHKENKEQSNYDKDMRLIKTQAIKKKPKEKLSFIESLSAIIDDEEKRDLNALNFMKKFRFKKFKEELLKETYDQFNKYAFDDQLPHDMLLVWNSRLSSTGGFCKNKTSLGKRVSEIHISTKVCDSPERMRDTLAHEMCHAAAFLINGLLDGHGKVWRAWANRVNVTFKLIPRITVKHSYEIKKKYVYRCQKCHLEIHRFSKSIDLEKELCGLCYGKFDLLKNDDKINEIREKQLDHQFDQLAGIKQVASNANMNVEATPSRQVNKFAQFVKENYGSIKKEKNLSSHKDVMQELSKNFKALSTK